MRRFLLGALVALIFPAVGYAKPHNPRLHKPADYALWAHVAQCESGGWQVLGAAYPNPVGITAHNWAWIGARPLPPGPLTYAQRVYVVRMADKFIKRLRIGIPDAGGSCAAW